MRLSFVVPLLFLGACSDFPGGGCPGENPSNSGSSLDLCLPVSASGRCSGDIAYGMICDGGEWRCPDGMRRIGTCTAFDSPFDTGARRDTGTTTVSDGGTLD